MEHKKTTAQLIVVANSQHVKFFVREAGQRLKLLTEKSMVAHHNPEKHASGFRSKGTRSHSFDPHTAAKDIDNDKAAKMITEYLYEQVIAARQQHVHYHIIITAEPKLLGRLRPCIKSHEEVHSLVVKEIDKDFIHEDLNHLQKMLDDAV